MTSPISRYRRELGVAGALVVLLALLAVMAPAFFRAANLRDLLVANAPVLVAAVGMTLVILARQIDISIGSQFAICGVAAGLLAKTGLPMPLVTAGVVATGAALGAINGALVAGLGLPAIVVTLATMVVLREGLRWRTVAGLPQLSALVFELATDGEAQSLAALDHQAPKVGQVGRRQLCRHRRC